MPKAPPARTVKRNHVFHSLKAKIYAGSLPPGACLPSRRDLSKEFHVSGGTITAAISQLAQEGLVVTKSRSGVFVAGIPEDNSSHRELRLPPRKTAAQRVAASIAEDISLGNYRSGELLPGRKTLRFQYKASTTTINAALESLRSKHLVHGIGSSVVVGPGFQRRSPAKHRVMICLPRPLDPRAPVFASLEDRFLNAFERELVQNGVSFSGQYDRTRSPGDTEMKRTAHENLGLVYPVAGPRWVERIAEGQIGHISQEMKRLARYQCPVVLFTCAPIINRFPTFSFTPYKSIYPLGIDNAKSGEDTAIFLSQLGHSHLAYFSYSSEAWNMLRFKGLEHGIASYWEGNGSVRGYHAGYERLALQAGRGKHLKMLKPELSRLAGKISAGFNFSKIDPSPSILRELYIQIDEEQRIASMTSLFKEALAHKDITAWVCSDPTVAQTAGLYLARKGIRVPRQLSLISLDDDRTLAVRGIAANNIQIDRMGYLAAHCILQDIPVRKNRRGIVECPGRIIERGSVARI